MIELLEASDKKDVDDSRITMVKEWDGEENLFEDDEEEEDDDDSSRRLSDMQIEIPKPTAKTDQVYKQATNAMKMLIANPSHERPRILLEWLNNDIEEDAKVNHIQINIFQQHYKIVKEAYGTLFEHSGEEYPRDKVPDNVLPPPNKNEPPEVKLERAKRDIPKAKGLIDKLIMNYHYPTDWAIPDAEYYRNLLRPGINPAQIIIKQETESQNPLIPKYDWYTLAYDNTSRIIGWRKVGGFGKQVCIERMEGGRLIRRLAAASTCGAGLKTVDNYCNIEGSKDLAKGQNSWSKKDRSDFVKLHWVTQSVTKNSPRDPATYCCVEFSQRGINILTVSNFRRVLSDDEANFEISKVCDRDGIIVPWKRGCLAGINYSPAKVKDLDERFKAVDNAASKQDSRPQRRSLKGKAPFEEDRISQSSEAEEPSSIIDRITVLESNVKRINKSITILEEISPLMIHQTEMIQVILNVLAKDKPEIRAFMQNNVTAL